MAGVKGKSGGKRKGAGRKPKKKQAQARRARSELSAAEQAFIGSSLPPGPNAPPPPAPVIPPSPTSDAKAFLESVVAGAVVPNEAQLRAAGLLLPFQHRKLGEGGKKEQQKEEAGKVASRFAAPTPPKLAAVDGKRI